MRGETKPARSRTGLVYGDIYLRHDTGEGHPERAARLVSIVNRLKQSGLWNRLERIEPAAAEERWITAVHRPGYVQHVRETCQRAPTHLDSGDTPVCRRSFDAALAAAGGPLAAIDRVVEGRWKNAFCAVRPPGHHALADAAMGFCLLNNVAIAARYLQRRHQLARVLIVDWDVHHGNGTQAAFYSDGSVLYFSAHQSPFYPFTGSAAERGDGKGQGCIVNVPLPAGSGDADYKRVFEEKLAPAAIAFRPDFVLVSAGFDAHIDDPLGQMTVTAEGFGELTRIVRRIARQMCDDRLISLLEGGYDLNGLAKSVEAHVAALLE